MYEDEFSIREEIGYEELTGLILPLKKGSGFNISISNDKLLKIHPSQRKEWFRLDLSILDIKTPMQPPKTAIRLLTETAPDLFKILRDRKEKRLKNQKQFHKYAICLKNILKPISRSTCFVNHGSGLGINKRWYAN
jgi:hypothetical protein